MILRRGSEGPDPLRSEVAGRHEHRRAARAGRLATGTLACPRCDAPVSPGPMGRSVAAAIACPFCGHTAAVRDFLSLDVPTRPARVEVRVVYAPPPAVP
jgi:hypothetical protein